VIIIIQTAYLKIYLQDSQAKIINVSHRVHYDYKKEQTFF